MATRSPKQEPAKRGRRTLLTRDRISRIQDFMSEGITGEAAAALVGIRRSAYYNYLARGRKEIERLELAGNPGGNPQPSEALFVELVDTVQKANSGIELMMLTRTRQAATDGTWQAAAWILERRFPTVYGKQYKEPAKDENNGAITKAIAALTNTPKLQGE